MRKKMTIKQKIFHFICFPILVFLVIFFLITLLNFFFKGTSFIITDRILTTSATTIGFSIAYWIGLVYPPKPHHHSTKREPPEIEIPGIY